jgi:hypothetical protein
MIAHDSEVHRPHDKVASGKSSEHRFVAAPTTRTNLRALVAGLGMAALGAGFYAGFMRDAPMPATPYLFGAGAVGIILAFVMGSADSAPLRVGDAGVAAEKRGAQPDRLAWWEIEKVSLDPRGRVVVEGAGRQIVAALDYHPVAAGWIVKEAMERLPKRVAIEPERGAELARAAEDDAGAVLRVEPAQVAGRRCKASNVIISFERDALTCRRCGEVYDLRHVPPKCLTCEAPMG